jgi:hypothetical protein
MDRVEYLREQAVRAERMASPALDALTVARLLAMSREYRQRAEQLEASLNGPDDGHAH